METKPKRRTLVVPHKRRTTDGKNTVNHHDHRKNVQMQRKRKACRCVRNTIKDLRRVSGQTRKGHSEKSRDDNDDSTDRGVPLRQYDPKLIRARSRFEGVTTPRNEWNRRLRTKIVLEQTSRTSTSKRKEENQDITRVARTRRRGYMFPSYTWCRGNVVQEKNRANLQRFCELIL